MLSVESQLFNFGKYPARLGVTDWIDMEGTSHP